MDGAANAAGVTPRGVSYHTDGSLSSVEGPRPRGGAARVAARGPCAPCGFPGGPHGGPRPRQPTPTPRTPRVPRPRVPRPRALSCAWVRRLLSAAGFPPGRRRLRLRVFRLPPAPPPVREWWMWGAADAPCMPSASDWRCGRGQPGRRRRYDGRSPRPAAAVPRRSGFVTPRTLPAQGRAGGWVEASPEPSGTASAPLAAAVGGWWANRVRFRGVCPLGGALREIGGRSSVIGRVCAAMCARWRGRRCVVGHSFGSAAVLTAAQAPRLRGARGRLRPRRPEGPEFQSPPESNLSRPNHQEPRDHPAWHIGGAENKRPQRPHPPKGARPAHRPRRKPPSDDRPAL